MARIKRNIILQGVSGGVEKKILLKQYGSKTILTTFPDRSKVKITQTQRIHNNRFREAMAYARAQMADPVAKAEYKAKTRDMQKPHNLAIADFYNPPVIHKIETKGFYGKPGDKICVNATDDFKVIRVQIDICNKADLILETGDAILQNNGNWEYVAKESFDNIVDFHIKARAWDKPGNLTEKTIAINEL